MGVKQLELQDLKGIEVKKDYVNQILTNNKYNQEVITKYYYQLQQEFSDVFEDTYSFLDDDIEVFIQRKKIIKSVNLDNKIQNLSNCNSWWLLDHYKEQRIKDFKKTNLCKDKFCNNCKKVKQASRLSKFMPLIDKYKEENNLYHLTLTVPNCKGSDLTQTIKTIFKSFKQLNRYLNGNLKIKGLDFEQYSYIGAIRSLEVTFKGNSYHPHLHCILAFNNPLINNKYIENTYSLSKKNGYRKFTEFEVLIQKIWYLLNNNIKVTKGSIDDLKLGYSCTIDDIDESSAYEVFKYMTKSTDEEKNILTYDNFRHLYFALHRVRQIQGYGCFYNVKDDDSIIEEVDYFYNKYIEELQKIENPLEVCETPEDLLNDSENMIISRKRIFSLLKKL